MTAEVLPPPPPLLGTGHCSRILRLPLPGELTPHLRPRPEAPAPLTGGGGGGEKSDDDDGCGRGGGRGGASAGGGERRLNVVKGERREGKRPSGKEHCPSLRPSVRSYNGRRNNPTHPNTPLDFERRTPNRKFETFPPFRLGWGRFPPAPPSHHNPCGILLPAPSSLLLLPVRHS